MSVVGVWVCAVAVCMYVCMCVCVCVMGVWSGAQL
jgi:hypothetical protein